MKRPFVHNSIALLITIVCWAYAPEMLAKQAKQAKQASVRSARFELTAKLQNDHVRVGERALVTFHLKNISPESISAVTTRPEYDIELVVVDARNKAVALTRLGKAMRYGVRVVTHGRAELVKPGQELTFDLDIGQLYEISKLGTYSIAGTYANPIYPSGKKEPVTSDRVTLTVVP